MGFVSEDQARDRAVVKAGHLSVYGHFAACVRNAPGAIAVRWQGVDTTYSELNERVLRLATVMLNAGVKPGDRIAILSENRREYAEILMAAAAIDAILACQNWRLALPEIQHCITLVTPRLTIASKQFADIIPRLDLGDSTTMTIGDDYETRLSAAQMAVSLPEVDPESGLVILYTSGTTGLPKAALISHRAEIARNAVLRIDMNASADDGFIAWAPMFHMGSTDQVLGSLISGATAHIVDGFDAEAIVEIAENYRIGWLFLAPGAIEPVIEAVERRGTKPKGVRVVGAMADLVPLHVIAAISRLMGAPFLNSFGSTETGLPPASASFLAPGAIPNGLSKRKSTMCDLRLVDPDCRDVADGQPGEAAVRGPTVFSGYWNNPEANAHDFKDGWFRMGDVFRRNPDGSFDFVDRAKYLIKSGGENIYPAEIERVLLSDPRIRDAVVVRQPDEKWGEVPIAFVARNDENLSATDIEAMCRASLAGYKRPKAIHFIAFEDLPRSTTGKIQRHEMEQRLKAMTSD